MASSGLGAQPLAQLTVHSGGGGWRWQEWMERTRCCGDEIRCPKPVSPGTCRTVTLEMPFCDFWVWAIHVQTHDSSDADSVDMVPSGTLSFPAPVPSSPLECGFGVGGRGSAVMKGASRGAAEEQDNGSSCLCSYRSAGLVLTLCLSPWHPPSTHLYTLFPF